MRVGALTRHRGSETEDTRASHQILTLTRLVNNGGLPLTSYAGGGYLPQLEANPEIIAFPPVLNVTHHLHLQGEGVFSMRGSIFFNQAQRVIATEGQGSIQGVGSIVRNGQPLEHANWRIGMQGRMIFSGRGQMTARVIHAGNWPRISQDVAVLQGVCVVQGIGSGDINIQGNLTISHNPPQPARREPELQQEPELGQE